MRPAAALKQRMQNVLLSDKISNPTRVLEVIKSDLFELLNNYMELSEDNLKVFLEIGAGGEYKLSLEAVTFRIKEIRMT